MRFDSDDNEDNDDNGGFPKAPHIAVSPEVPCLWLGEYLIVSTGDSANNLPASTPLLDASASLLDTSGAAS